MNETNGKAKKGSAAAKYVAKLGILTAIAEVLMLFELPLPFVAPSFYELDISETVILIGGFSMGPIAAVIIELLKNLLNLLINGTATYGIGELGNFLIGCALTVPASVIYKFNKTRKGALVSLVTGTVGLAVIGGVINYFLLIPAYAQAIIQDDISIGAKIDIIVGMGGAIFPWVKNLFAFVVSCVMPFNLIKGVICSIVCYILYKRVSPVLHI